MLSIRLSRGGAKKRPYYKVVVADKRMKRDGRFIEIIGRYDPMLKEDNDKRVILQRDRLEHWLSVGAKPSDRLLRFMEKIGMAQRTIPQQTKKHLPRKAPPDEQSEGQSAGQSGGNNEKGGDKASS